VLGTIGGAVLVIVNLCFAIVLGTAAGGLTCLVIRQRWSLKVCLVDSVVALCAALIAACIATVFLTYEGVWGSAVGVSLGVAPISVVAWHLLRQRSRVSN
jgi:hypothetical protein